MKKLFLLLFLFFHTVTVNAQQSFPFNGVIDNFNRANEGPPPSSSWTDANGSSDLRVVSNQLTPGLATEYTSGYSWNPVQYGPNIEVYITISNQGSNGNGAGRLFWRADSVLHNGYDLAWDAFTDTIIINSVTTDVETAIGATVSQTIGNGDSIGVSMVGSDISLWYKVSGGTWALLTTRTDTTWTSAGYLGIDLYNPGVGTNPILDDFGGGSLNTKALVTNARISQWK